MRVQVGNLYTDPAVAVLTTDDDRDYRSGDVPINLHIVYTRHNLSGICFSPAEARVLGAALVAAAREQESF